MSATITIWKLLAVVFAVVGYGYMFHMLTRDKRGYGDLADGFIGFASGAITTILILCVLLVHSWGWL